MDLMNKELLLKISKDLQAAKSKSLTPADEKKIRAAFKKANAASVKMWNELYKVKTVMDKKFGRGSHMQFEEFALDTVTDANRENQFVEKFKDLYNLES